MAFSDDDEVEEAVPESVTEYHFVDDKEEPVCFSLLPLRWDEGESLDAHDGQVFLHGKTDDGLQKIYKQVVAWKMEIGGVSPEVKVLSKDKRWLKLLKPRRAYEDLIRGILITLECLFYVKKNPASSDKSLWEHVRKVFSQFEVRASEDDLLDHLTLIQTMVKRDESLSTSQLLPKFLDDLPKKKTSTKGLQNDQKIHKSDFINDSDAEETGNDDGDESEEEVECFDTVCAICDNGGELLCCEGQCLRSFHATKDAGVESDCKSLGYTRAKVHAIQNFLCPNCAHKKHQCFVCGKLGNSDKESGAEVFRCISASCGHFYHPRCVTKLLHPENEDEADALEKKIAAGESFLCPVHKCVVCGQFEDKTDKDLQFAMCRRCPRTYHRKCLPRKISFEDSEDEDNEVRAWDGLIPNRILIYCLKHKIDEDLGTPIRNHIIFPGTPDSKIEAADSRKVKVLAKRKAEGLLRDKASEKLSNIIEKMPSKKLKASGTSETLLKDRAKKGSALEVKRLPLRDEKVSTAMPSGELVSLKSVKKDLTGSKVEGSRKNLGSSLPSVDDETKKRIMLLVKRSPSSSLTVEDLLKKRRLPTTYAHCTRHVGKTITQGKVEGSIEAIRAALQKFEIGCSIQDAKAVCGPDILNQILSWKKKFRVYLAPFLHGARYSSYGRHFTKVNKLEEIVERLHWYVRSGDMIVDFCCGANDFSLLMKKKLEATGKKCLFKNYDLFHPKNDFNFEKRDWMTVHPRELPTGSQLIMGLNPPFGVNAALANKFIDKALEFKPKLLVLIVPKETERLDTKAAAYDLIWEDEEKLSGMSFYLPGSVDVNDNQIEQWNNKPPALYLWSRPDWTDKHKVIAAKYGHLSNVCEEPKVAVDKDSLASVCQREDQNHSGTPTDVLRDLSTGQNDRAMGPEEKGASLKVQADSSRLENDVDRKAGQETAQISDKEKPRTKAKKKSRKRKSKKPEEVPGNRTADNMSDMSISPPHQRESQKQIDGNPPVDARSDAVTAGLAGYHRPAEDFTKPHGGTRDGNLPKEDIESVERRYATSSWSRSFSSSSSYDRPNEITGRSSYEGHYGSLERFAGYARDSHVPPYVDQERAVGPDTHTLLDMYGKQGLGDTQRGRDGRLPRFDSVPYVNEERAVRPDAHTLLDVYGKPGVDDTRRSWHTASGASSVLSQPSSFASPSYGLSSSGIGSSAMSKYAPRLDELNYAGPGHSMSNLSRSNVFETPGSRTSYNSSGIQNSYLSQRSSGGWLDEL